MGKRKKMTIFLLAVLCILAITPMTADAAKLKVFEKGTELHDSCIQSHQ